MTVSVNEIIALTLARLGESGPLLDDAVEFGSPDFDIRERIRLQIPFAAEEVIREADMVQIREWLPLTAGASYRGGVGIVELPEDFMRLLFIRMSDWESGLTRFVEADSDVASLHRLWARRGRLCHVPRPCVAIDRGGEGYRLEIFGSRLGATIAEAGWLPLPTVVGNTLRFPRSLLASLVARLTL